MYLFFQPIMPEDDAIKKSVVLEVQEHPSDRRPGVSEGTNTSYEDKMKVVNAALEEIGMGRYQWYVRLI